jgi:hypothetical protein
MGPAAVALEEGKAAAQKVAKSMVVLNDRARREDE